MTAFPVPQERARLNAIVPTPARVGRVGGQENRTCWRASAKREMSDRVAGGQDREERVVAEDVDYPLELPIRVLGPVRCSEFRSVL
jgi:hypothetical protein